MLIDYIDSMERWKGDPSFKHPWKGGKAKPIFDNIRTRYGNQEFMLLNILVRHANDFFHFDVHQLHSVGYDDEVPSYSD